MLCLILVDLLNKIMPTLEQKLSGKAAIKGIFEAVAVKNDFNRRTFPNFK